MDGYRDFPSEFDAAASEAIHGAPSPAPIPDPSIGTDERRMHVRAYNYWVSLLDGRDYPSIEDLEPADLEDFSAHSVLLDFTCGQNDPATPYIGAAIRAECGLDEDIKSIDQVPSRSLLSRLTDHYMQIIANRAPVGFEAEFDNQRGQSICYRGILMPFSSDGDTIDFIYGVINWKQGAERAAMEAAQAVVPILAPIEPEDEPLDLTEAVAESAAMEAAQAVVPVEAPMEPGDEPLDLTEAVADSAMPSAPAYAGDLESIAETHEIEVELGDDAGLADRLWAARETAEAVKSADHRSRSALYRALALAYDFAVSARDNPDDYSELLEESGMKAQARAPMTPIVKLVFGVDYDKTRLTEFASALSHAQRNAVGLGGFMPFIEGFSGGLKAIVAAERQARRPEPKPDTAAETARERLRNAPPLKMIVSEQEFSLLVTRRCADGSHQAIALVADEALLERAIRKAAA